MIDPAKRTWLLPGLMLCCALLALGCKSRDTTPPAARAPFMSAVAGNAPSPADEAPPPDKTDGFDGKRAYDQVAKQVSFGPRPAGSASLAKLQDYLQAELKSYGCAVETDSFSADTPAGRLSMKNILVKIPGEKPGIILLGTHYDTKRLDNFVGADDSGSSTGVMLEIARILCARKEPGKYAVWVAFFDGEEAVRQQWQDPDNRYGSRQMAAQFAASGDLKKIKVFLLADIVGSKRLELMREDNSTKQYADLVWKTGQKLGYPTVFVEQEVLGISDDHLSFSSRGVPVVDLIDMNTTTSYWHTPEDTLDKISPKSLAIVGHTLLESVKELQQK
jgi:glutaminyl-peptide cyclotransferase